MLHAVAEYIRKDWRRYRAQHRAWRIREIRKLRKNPPHPRCHRCGYDRIGFDGAAPCPECGARYNIRKAWRRDGRCPIWVGSLISIMIAPLMIAAALVIDDQIGLKKYPPIIDEFIPILVPLIPSTAGFGVVLVAMSRGSSNRRLAMMRAGVAFWIGTLVFFAGITVFGALASLLI